MTHITFERAQERNAKHNSFLHLFDVWRQRQQLKRLDAAALEDLGLTRAEADQEAARSFWDAPQTWRC